MKTYQKPALLALSLSANDMLCGGCSFSTRFDNDPFLNLILSSFDNWDSNDNGVFDAEDAAALGLFGSGESCNTPVDNYCKYTVDGTIIFTS